MSNECVLIVLNLRGESYLQILISIRIDLHMSMSMISIWMDWEDDIL